MFYADLMPVAQRIECLPGYDQFPRKNTLGVVAPICDDNTGGVEQEDQKYKMSDG